MGERQHRSSESDEYRNDLPGPLHKLLVKFEQEAHPFTKINRLIDVVEWVVKWHAAVLISELLNQGQLSDRLKLALARGLRSPSLGLWLVYCREASVLVESNKLPHEFAKRLLELESSHSFVALRNKYAHGGTPSDESCWADLEKYEPVIHDLLRTPALRESVLICSTGDGAVILIGDNRFPADVDLARGHTAVVYPPDAPNTRAFAGDRYTLSRYLIDLWPLGVSVEKQDLPHGFGFFFYNSLRSRSVEQLNYEIPRTERDHHLLDAFMTRFPIRVWLKGGNVESRRFADRINALTESFVGRSADRSRVKEFCASGYGVMVIWGTPGSGKSALVAQCVREIRSEAAESNLESDAEAFESGIGCRRPVDRIVIEYFIRRGYESEDEVTFLTSLNRRLDAIFQLDSPATGQSLAELVDSYRTRLRMVDALEPEHGVVLIVDGLDENTGLLRLLPEPRRWLSIVLTSRPNREVQTWEHLRSVSNRNEWTLGALDKDDVRAYLHRVAHKHGAVVTDDFVAIVAEKSEGNPLYLQLLCDVPRHGPIGDGELPPTLGDMYSTVVDRITHGGAQTTRYDLLLLLTVSRASLSAEAIAGLLSLPSVQSAAAALNGVEELLVEDSSSAVPECYQLFHESLRDWIETNRTADCRRMRRNLAMRCAAFREIDSSEALSYTARHAAYHLLEAGMPEEAWGLIQDGEFQLLQMSEPGGMGIALGSIGELITYYATSDDDSPEVHARLCRLLLQAATLRNRTPDAVREAFNCLRDTANDEKSRADAAVLRLRHLDEAMLYVVGISLLLTEAEIQLALPADDRDSTAANAILAEINNRVPQGTTAVDWGHFFSADFMARWFDLLCTVLGAESLSGINTVLLRCGHEIEDMVDRWAADGNAAAIDLILQILDTVQDKDEGTTPYRTEVLETVVKRLFDRGLIEYARKAAERIKPHKRSGPIWLAILVALTGYGTIDDWHTVTVAIQDDYLEVALSIIALHFLDLGRKKEALSVLHGDLRDELVAGRDERNQGYSDDTLTEL